MAGGSPVGPRELDAVHSHHPHVEDHHVGLEAASLLDGLGAVGRGRDLVAVVDERHAHEVPDAVVVVHDEHAPGVQCPLRWRPRAGIVIVTDVPPPSGNDASMVPPWSSTIWRLM